MPPIGAARARVQHDVTKSDRTSLVTQMRARLQLSTPRYCPETPVGMSQGSWDPPLGGSTRGYVAARRGTGAHQKELFYSSNGPQLGVFFSFKRRLTCSSLPNEDQVTKGCECETNTENTRASQSMNRASAAFTSKENSGRKHSGS